MMTLLQFGQLVLHVAPKLLWWVLGLLAFSVLNLMLYQEVWPNTPAAQVFFALVAAACGLALPWLGARVAWLLAEAVESFFWKALWRLAAVSAYGGCVLLMLIVVVELMITL